MPPRRLQTLLFLALGACTPTETPERSDTDLDTDAPPTTGIDSGTSSPVGTGVGLSAEHPYDQGIETHPDVLFVADFEELDWADAWQEIARPECKENEEAPEIVHAGDRSLRLVFEATGTCGDNGGAGWMHYWPDNGDTGYEVAYLRYHYRVSAGGDWSNNKVLQMHGHELGVKYGDGAGVPPDGTTFSVGTGISGDSGPPWGVGVLYTYHMHQPGNYGETFQPNQGVEPPILEETWYCKEFMVQLNDVGAQNGEQRMWLDDVLIVETTGLELRVSDTVMMNNVMQPSYTSAPDTKEMWLDSLVLARSRVGCMYRP